ncbi:unnamed protein product, partial [Timema podura]|nr:unnamed protein product [Timema podura]
AKKLYDEVKEKEVLDLKEERLPIEGIRLEDSPGKKPGESVDITIPSKRPRDQPDREVEPKKVCLDDSVPLEELSDISDDDADEILNREDSVDELAAVESEVMLAPQGGPSTPLSQRATEEHTY